jgi:cytochrome oxidase Cu insertion factor (SCO1/SenC/PrrC family)
MNESFLVVKIQIDPSSDTSPEMLKSYLGQSLYGGKVIDVEHNPGFTYVPDEITDTEADDAESTLAKAFN